MTRPSGWTSEAPVFSGLSARSGPWTQVPHAQADGAKGPGGASRGRVLIVEDEFFVALDAEDALDSAGFAVVGIATTAEEAISMAAAEQPDIVLMDIRLAGRRDGIDAALEIRRRFGIPSIFATAHSDGETRARGEKAAPVAWLTKPYTQGEVVAAIDLALRRRGGQG